VRRLLTRVITAFHLSINGLTTVAPNLALSKHVLIQNMISSKLHMLTESASALEHFQILCSANAEVLPRHVYSGYGHLQNRLPSTRT
jgi:hypothetical protein